MTTLSTVFGVLPIALGLGAGAESRKPLGMAVVGGMLFSTWLTLVVVPVFYTVLARYVPARKGADLEQPDDAPVAVRTPAPGGAPAA